MPIEPVSAAAVVALIAPYLVKMAEAAAEKAGEAGADAAGKVVGWLRTKLTGRAREALADLESSPADELNQADLTKQLAKMLQENPTLAEELRAILPADIAESGAMSQTVSGEGAKAAQVRGSNNRTNIL